MSKFRGLKQLPTAKPITNITAKCASVPNLRRSAFLGPSAACHEGLVR